MQKEGKNGEKAQTTNHKTEEQHTKIFWIQRMVGFITWAVQEPRSIDIS